MERRHLIIGGVILGTVIVGARLLSGGGDSSSSGAGTVASAPPAPTPKPSAANAPPAPKTGPAPAQGQGPGTASPAPTPGGQGHPARRSTTGPVGPAPAPPAAPPAGPRPIRRQEVDGKRAHAAMLVQELGRQQQNPVLMDAARTQQAALAQADGAFQRREYQVAADRYDEIAAESQVWLTKQGEIDRAVHARNEALALRDEASALDVASSIPEKAAADAAWADGETAFDAQEFDAARTKWTAAVTAYRSAVVAHLFAEASEDAKAPERCLTAKVKCERILELDAQHTGAKEVLAQAVAAVGYENAYEMSFVLVPAGQFMMGTPNGEPGRHGDETHHPVRLTKPYYIQTTEVTQAQWDAVMGYNPSAFVSPRLPVENVSWEMAQAFCRRLSELTGHGYRLPTEAEWEYACRAGTRGPYAAADPSALGWFNANSGNRTHAVGEMQPNGWGLHDMHGNVGEWCADVFHQYPGPGQVRVDPFERPQNSARPNTHRIVRGGTFGSRANDLRSARRLHCQQVRTEPWLGFRVVLEAESGT